jgi:hypothetical protein
MSPDKKVLKDISDTEWISAPDKILSMRGSATRPLFRINRNYQPPML